MAVKLAHGLKDGKIVRIKEVKNGLSCGCLCPNPKCRAQLIAVQGRETAWHFRHYADNYHGELERECEGARETAIHLIAKDLLSEELEQILPARVLTIRRHNFDEIKQEHNKFIDCVVQKQTTVVFDSIRSENEYSGHVVTDGSFIKPDVIAVKGEMEIYFEILVTHAVDDLKCEKIKKLGRSCIEIDLRNVDRNVSLEALKLEVLNPKNRRWVCHRKDKDFYLKETKLEETKGQYYRQKRAEEKKKEAELARIKREQEEKAKNLQNYKSFEIDLHKELLSWREGFAEEKIQRFINSEEIEGEESTILNKYDSAAYLSWYSEDENDVEWEINFCGDTYYSYSEHSNDEEKCISQALFNFLLDICGKDAIEQVNLRETRNREEKEKRRLEREEYLKKLEIEKALHEQAEKERVQADLERKKQEIEKNAIIRKNLEIRAKKEHDENKSRFMAAYLKILIRKSINSPLNKDVIPSEIKSMCGFNDQLFIGLRRELQEEKKLKQVPESKLLTAKL